ncbi:MAG: hypothetical protein LBE91_17575 [Tannerella sp.]|jgi:hypothetical protein|nr:hypothetical protein [Tannerella sp.]
MSTTRKNIWLIIALSGGLYGAFAQNENPVISAIQKEVDRNKTELKLEDMAPPFFISYTVLDIYNYNLSASLGNISNYNEYHNRRGVPTLLVGDYLRNNSKLAERPNYYRSLTSLYENTPGIALTVWNDLDREYKTATEQYKAKMAVISQQTQTEAEKNLPDYEQVEPVNIILQPVPVNFNKAYWENYLRKASETAKQYPDIISSNISFYMRNATSYTYNTEGSRYAVPNTLYQLVFTAGTRASDGQELFHSLYTENATFEQMPDIETYIKECKKLMEDLLKLKEAPVIDEAYSGPVLLEGKAVEYFFRFAFFNNGRLYASPKLIQQNSNYYNNLPTGGNDFELMLNKKVMARNITVKSITGQEFYNGKRLNGYYPVDAEGVVPAKELMLIENGVLRNMLNGRSPTQKFQHSNGHVRYDFNDGSLRVMPGNILITCNQTFSNDELRKKLLDAAREEDLEYAYIIHDMFLGLISRIYVADGREELVRGANVTDLGNLKTFKRIMGASDREQTYSFDLTQSEVIYPDAMLFEEMDINRTQNIEFKKPYIVPKPN